MSEEENKGLAELKRRLQERVDQLQSEAGLLREAISVIDEKLAGTSFRRASDLAPPASAPLVTPGAGKEAEVREEQIPLTYKGRDLGKVSLASDQMIIEPDPAMELTSATRPFEAFFVRKMLEGIREADTVAVAKRAKRPDQILSYDLDVEGPFIRRIIIRNVGGRDRVKEIVNAAGWTFNTMMQNIESQRGAQPK